MKPIYYILITIVLIAIAFLGYDHFNKKKLATIKNNSVSDGKDYIPSKQNSIEREKVKELQRSLNNVLKLHNKTLLVVDGIKGKLTKQAIIDVANLQNQTPSSAYINVEKGGQQINVKVNYDVVYNKTKQFVKDISGYSALTNLFS